MGLLLCWVPYTALGVLGAQCGHCSEKLLVIKGKGYLPAAWNRDHAQYTFQLVYKYIKKKCSGSVPSPALQDCKECNSLALQELIIRFIWFGLSSNAMKLTFCCPLPPAHPCALSSPAGAGKGWCCDPRAASCGSHSPAFPLLWLWEQVFSVGLTPSPFSLCQALYWPQELHCKVGVSTAFFNSLIPISSAMKKPRQWSKIYGSWDICCILFQNRSKQHNWMIMLMLLTCLKY